MRYCLLCFSLLLLTSVRAQRYLGDEAACLTRYDSLARAAMAANEVDQSHRYQGDSIRSCFLGERVPVGELVTIDGDTVGLGERDRPYVLYFTASWCGPCVSNTEALNVVLDSLAPAVDVIVLSWDQPEYFAENRGDYHRDLSLIPSRNGKNEAAEVINGPLKHTIGFPSVYTVNSDQAVVGFQRGASMPMELPDGRVISAEEAVQQNVGRWVKLLEGLE